MDTLVVMNVSGESVTILGIEIPDSESYIVPTESILTWSKDAYLRVLCTYGDCELTVYDKVMVESTATDWLARVSSGNIIYA